MSGLSGAKVLVTGASGVAGRWTCAQLKQQGASVRAVDVGAPHPDLEETEFRRCDTRTYSDVRAAADGMDAVIHLAAWHCAHNPPVSDATIFGVNVDGTFNVVQACREAKVKTLAFASSMAYGWGGVYSVTKVIGEDLGRCFHEISRAPVALLRPHDFVPKPYLAWGEKLLRNGVDAHDVASAFVAAVEGGLESKFTLLRSIVHTAHGMPPEVVEDFVANGPQWCESQVPGARELLQKYSISLPQRVEQHDMSEAARVLDWRPQWNFGEFLRDLKARDERGEDVQSLWAPGILPEARA